MLSPHRPRPAAYAFTFALWLLGLLVPVAAHAQTADQRFPVDGPLFQQARSVAVQHWGTEPCGGRIAYRWTTALDTQTNGIASWTNPQDVWAVPALNGDCVIELNATTEYDWAMLCTVVAHELGHLLGFQHDGEGRLMSAIYSGELPACVAADPTPRAPARPRRSEVELEVGLDEAERSSSRAERPRTHSHVHVERRRCVRRLAARRARTGARTRGRGCVRRTTDIARLLVVKP